MWMHMCARVCMYGSAWSENECAKSWGAQCDQRGFHPFMLHAWDLEFQKKAMKNSQDQIVKKTYTKKLHAIMIVDDEFLHNF